MGEVVAAPIIVTALFGAADFAWLDGLRRVHFPPARNQLAAHLTLFHHLAPSLAGELDRRLKVVTRRPAPVATVSAVMSLGRGVAYRVASDDLAMIRADLADAFAAMLTRRMRPGGARTSPFRTRCRRRRRARC